MMITATTADLNEAEFVSRDVDDRRKSMSDQSVGSTTR
jgi:hypothetical protein